MRDFNWSVNVLAKAYLNNTLERGSCLACAVGNLVAAGLGGVKFSAHSIFGGHGWPAVFCTDAGYQRINADRYSDEAKRQIDATGYTWQELARIEKAFEGAPKGDDPMFNGLMAVIDVLASIHGINLEETQQAKNLFVKV